MKKIFYSALTLLFFIHLDIFSQNTSLSEQFIDWDNDAGWSERTSPGALTYADDIEIDGSVLRIDDLDLNFFSVLTINTDDSLVVDGNLNVSATSQLIVEEGGYLYINGNLVNEGSFIIIGDFTNDGIIAVSGNYVENGFGDLNTGANSNFYVNGTSDDPTNTDGPIPPDIQNIYDFLPIELKSFEGELARNSTQLKWITAKEENFSHFELERSINEKSFEVIGVIEGQGNSLTDVYYDFVDYSIPFGIIRYRLKAVDINNSFEYFDAIEIKNTFSNQVIAYPNPTSKISAVKIVLPKEFAGKLDKVSLFDASGLNLYSSLDYDPQSSKIELGDLTEGMYILRIYHNGLTENLRVFVH